MLAAVLGIYSKEKRTDEKILPHGKAALLDGVSCASDLFVDIDGKVGWKSSSSIARQVLPIESFVKSHSKETQGKATARE